MERRELPNATLILVFGILSIVGCCCYGVAGIVFGIIAIVMANKSMNLYYAEQNPEAVYSGFKNVKTGRILAIIGLVLSALSLVSSIVMLFYYGGYEAWMEAMEEISRANV